MKDMKVSKEEAKKHMGVEAPAKPKPHYPWGLKLNLEKSELKKLGLTAGSFKIGDKVTVQAVCSVTDISDHKSEGDDGHSSVGIQIQKMSVSGPNKVARARQGETGGTIGHGKAVEN